MNMSKKIQKMKSGTSILFDTYPQVRSFRALCYKLNRKPVSRKTLDNKYRVYVYDSDTQASEVSA